MSKKKIPEWLKCAVLEQRKSEENVASGSTAAHITKCKKLMINDSMSLFVEGTRNRKFGRVLQQCNANGWQSDSCFNTVEKKISESFPYIEYKGIVKYLNTYDEIANACDTLLTWVSKQVPDRIIPIAFDMEWPFSFQTGSEKTAVIQLCADIKVCYVFHLTNIRKLPTTLCVLLKHDRVQLHGINIKNDFRKLERDFPEINAQQLIDQCKDLGPWCNEVKNTSGQWSMERLVIHLCKLRINKDRSVRNSQWNIIPLSKEQQIYAAIDVYISQIMYYKLQNLEEQKHKLQNERKFLHEYEKNKFQVNIELLHIPKRNSLKRSKSIDEAMKSKRMLKSVKRRRQSDSCLIEENIIEKEFIESLPYIEYNGIVKYLILFDEIAYACDELLTWVNKQGADKIIPIACHMECPFSFQTGSDKTAVIELCADINFCYVFHLTNIKKLPAALCVLLKHDRVQLHGVNIKNDCRKLERDFPEMKTQKLIEQCRDLGSWCNEIKNTNVHWTMERLVNNICEPRINKDKKVGDSKWDIIPLSKEQQISAAINVYISQVMYYKLQKLEEQKTKETNEFVEKYGEKAFAVVNMLL